MHDEQKWMGCSTTVDQVQQQQYSTRSTKGMKRSHEQSHTDSPACVVFKDIATFSSSRDYAKRQCLNSGGNNRIVASKICNVANGSPGSASGLQPRQHIPPVPGASQNPLLSLAHPKYGLPKALVMNLASLGINSIYPWQTSCLLVRGLLDGSRNLVYTAPTGGGKSLVADVLMLKRVIEDPTKKALLVLPYVALVQEKLKWLRRVVEGVQKSFKSPSQCSSQLPQWRKPHDSSVRVVGFFGGSKVRATWSDVDIAICTIEKVVRRTYGTPAVLTS